MGGFFKPGAEYAALTSACGAAAGASLGLARAGAGVNTGGGVNVGAVSVTGVSLGLGSVVGRAFLGSGGLATGLGLGLAIGLAFSGGLAVTGGALGGCAGVAAAGCCWLGALVRATSITTGGFASGKGGADMPCQACQMPECKTMEIRQATTVARTGQRWLGCAAARVTGSIQSANKLMWVRPTIIKAACLLA